MVKKGLDYSLIIWNNVCGSVLVSIIGAHPG